MTTSESKMAFLFNHINHCITISLTKHPSSLIFTVWRNCKRLTNRKQWIFGKPAENSSKMNFSGSTQSNIENFSNVDVVLLNPCEVAPFPRWSEKGMYVKTWHPHFDNFSSYRKTMLPAPPSPGTTCFWVSHSLNEFRWAPVRMKVSAQYVSVLCLFPTRFEFDQEFAPLLYRAEM